MQESESRPRQNRGVQRVLLHCLFLCSLQTRRLHGKGTAEIPL